MNNERLSCYDHKKFCLPLGSVDLEMLIEKEHWTHHCKL